MLSMFFRSQLFRHLLRTAVVIFLLALVIYSVCSFGASGMDYEWQWSRAWHQIGVWNADGFALGPLFKGAALTVAIAALGITIAIILGICAVFLRLSPWPFCSFLSQVYVTLWRNTPLLIQLFFAYFLISPLLDWSPFTTAVIALATFEGAYMAEVFRGAILSVPKWQWEAATSLGLSPIQTFRSVVMPQAVVNGWPAITNQAIATLKDTSLVSAIAVADLTMCSQAIVAETFLAFEIWLLAGALYLILALLLALPALSLERRWAWRKPHGVHS